MKRISIAAIVVLATLPARAVVPEQATVMMGFGASTVQHAGGSYVQHAEVFGFDKMDEAHGQHVEVGHQLSEHWSLFGSYGQAGAKASRRTSELKLETQYVFADARYALARVFSSRHGCMAQLEVLGGVGYHHMDESLDSYRQTAGGLAGRLGAVATGYWQWFGFSLGYAFHISNATVSDRLGGRIGEGTHEVLATLGLRL